MHRNETAKKTFTLLVS